MKQYQLQPTEVVLYEINHIKVKGKKGNIGFILTNLNFVFEITTTKMLFSKYTTTECFAINTVKMYNEKPQVKQQGLNVQIYFLDTERTLIFNARSEARKFTAKALELLTGKNAFFRGLEKTKKTVDNIDETLGIDTMGTAGNIVRSAANLTPAGKMKKTKAMLGFAGGLLPKKEPAQIEATSSMNDNIETLRKLKLLLDDGTITQEEFDIKKKELLNL